MLEMIDVWLWSLMGIQSSTMELSGNNFCATGLEKIVSQRYSFVRGSIRSEKLTLRELSAKRLLFTADVLIIVICVISLAGEGHAVDANISRCTFGYCLRTNSFFASDSCKHPDHETPVMSWRPIELLFFHCQQPSTEPVQQVFHSRELTSPQRCPFESSYEIWLEDSLGHRKHPLIVLKSRQNRWFEQGGMSAEYS